MGSPRSAVFRSSLKEALATAAREQHLTPNGQVRWLSAQFENYLERWLAFCAMPEIPMASLLKDDLFAMLEVGAGELANALVSSVAGVEARGVWRKFADSLNVVRTHGRREDALRLRDVFAELKHKLDARRE